LDKREFTKAMSVLRVTASRSDIDLLYERFDRDRSNTLDYTEFIALLKFDVSPRDSHHGAGDRDRAGAHRGSVSRDVERDSDELLLRVKRSIMDHMGRDATPSVVKRTCAEIDRDRNGVLDKVEFLKAMTVLKVHLTRSEVDLLYERLDIDRSGTLDYTEFIKMLHLDRSPIAGAGAGTGAGPSREVERESHTLLLKIRRELQDHMGRDATPSVIKRTFAEIDRDRNGVLDKVEFLKAMTVLKVHLTRSEVDLLYERFDVDRSGTLDYTEFIRLLDIR
jgi:Ca2+-binding EF-hand superfamily protein